MNTKIDWHYHLSGRNIKEDIVTLKNYIHNENMEQVYIMATYFPENGSGVSNYNLYHHIKDIPEVKMYLSLDFNSYYFMHLNEIESILEESRDKVIGIKIYSGYQDIEYYGNDKFNKILEIARKHNLYIMFHTGYLKGNKEKFKPMELEYLFLHNPDINFILAHLSNPFISECIYLLSNHSNLYTDISGLIDRKVEIADTTKLVYKVAEQIDKDKILFGTDYPMQNYKTTLIFSDEVERVNKIAEVVNEDK
jgi:hypothetical protein